MIEVNQKAYSVEYSTNNIIELNILAQIFRRDEAGDTHTGYMVSDNAGVSNQTIPKAVVFASEEEAITVAVSNIEDSIERAKVQLAQLTLQRADLKSTLTMIHQNRNIQGIEPEVINV